MIFGTNKDEKLNKIEKILRSFGKCSTVIYNKSYNEIQRLIPGELPSCYSCSHIFFFAKRRSYFRFHDRLNGICVYTSCRDR